MTARKPATAATILIDFATARESTNTTSVSSAVNNVPKPSPTNMLPKEMAAMLTPRTAFGTASCIAVIPMVAVAEENVLQTQNTSSTQTELVAVQIRAPGRASAAPTAATLA